MIESIYKSYPFCENWEKKHCKSVIEEAYQWGEQLKKKNIKQKINTRINMMRSRVTLIKTNRLNLLSVILHFISSYQKLNY